MADQKITALTADTSPTDDDLVVTVNDPAGSPANKKVTLANLRKYILGTFVAGVTAAGINQAGATQLVGAYSFQEIISGTAGSAFGVRLPTIITAPPSSVTVYNRTTISMMVYANTGQSINSMGTTRGFYLPSGAAVTFTAKNSTVWLTDTFIEDISGVVGDMYQLNDAFNSGTAIFLKAITTGATVGDATNVPVITYDDKGRVTGITTVPISFPPSVGFQGRYLDAQYDKSADTSLSGISGFDDLIVEDTKYYKFVLDLPVDLDASGGFQIDMGGGSCSAANARYQVEFIDDATHDDLVDAGTQRQTSLGGIGSYSGGVITNGFIRITGSIKCNGTGTLIPRFAQFTASGTSSILEGSTFIIEEIYIKPR